MSRDAKDLYLSSRGSGTVWVLDFATRKVLATWTIPGEGTPHMGNASADDRVLWRSGRYDNVVYAIDARRARLLAEIPVARGPHGSACGLSPRLPLGHTGIMR